MTAYLSTTGKRERGKRRREFTSSPPYLLTFSPVLLGDQRIALRERPRARDVEDVGVALDVRREARKRSRHLDDLHRPGVQDAAAGAVGDVDFLYAAVAFDREREQKAAVQPLLSRGLRIVEVA